MTTSRVIRGTKAKIFLYVSGVLIITGLIACYNNALTQLDEVKKSNEICHQQQENLSTQLQVISDYKQKLEKSLKNEKAEYQQIKSNMETKLNEEKNRSKKEANDASIKYNTLRQHYNLLETQHNDFKEESSKIQKKQLDEINSLQSKLKEVEEEVKKVKVSKENLKTQFVELETENQQIKIALKQKAIDNEAQKTIQFFSEKYHNIEEQFKALQVRCGETEKEFKVNIASEESVQNLPKFKLAEKPSSSTKTIPKASPSQGNLNGARPLLQPSVTPETAKKEANLKPPLGVPAVPEDRENQNEQPEIKLQKKADGDVDKDNGANEEFDQPQIIPDELGFGDDGVRQGIEKKNVDQKKHDEVEYKDLQREVEGDDEPDEYPDHQARIQDPAVRN